LAAIAGLMTYSIAGAAKSRPCLLWCKGLVCNFVLKLEEHAAGLTRNLPKFGSYCQ